MQTIYILRATTIPVSIKKRGGFQHLVAKGDAEMLTYRLTQITAMILVILTLVLGEARKVTAESLDQSFVPPIPSVISGVSGDFGESAQTFTVGISGVLSRVNVLLANEKPNLQFGNLYFDIRPTVNGFPVEEDMAAFAFGSMSISLLPPRPLPLLFSFDVSSFGVHVTSGDVLAIVLRSDSGTDVGWYGVLGDAYPLGDLYGRGPVGSRDLTGGWSRSHADLGFQTFVEPVPEPTTIILLGTGLAGTVAAVRKRKKKGS